MALVFTETVRAKWMEGAGVKPDGSMAMPPLCATYRHVPAGWVVGITAAQNALLAIILLAMTIIVLLAANGMFE
jgi:hypothetical protein